MVGRKSPRHPSGRAARLPSLLEVRGLAPLARPLRQWRLKDTPFRSAAARSGIAGLMGAGRTELLECLFGSSPSGCRAGSCSPAAKSFRHPSEARRAGVALVTEDRKRLGLFANLDVLQNVTIAVLQQLVRSGLLLLGAARPGVWRGEPDWSEDGESHHIDHYAQRRQPAEGDPRPLAAHPAQG